VTVTWLFRLKDLCIKIEYAAVPPILLGTGGAPPPTKIDWRAPPTI